MKKYIEENQLKIFYFINVIIVLLTYLISIKLNINDFNDLS